MSGRQSVRRPLQSDGPHGVPDKDGVQGINRLPVSAMNESIAPSAWDSLLPFGLKHPPFASALAKAVKNAASALARHSGLTIVFLRTAIAWQVSLASVFRFTARSFASPHFIARRADAERAPFAAVAPSTSPSSTTIVTLIPSSSHPCRPPPLDQGQC